MAPNLKRSATSLDGGKDEWLLAFSPALVGHQGDCDLIIAIVDIQPLEHPSRHPSFTIGHHLATNLMTVERFSIKITLGLEVSAVYSFHFLSHHVDVGDLF